MQPAKNGNARTEFFSKGNCDGIHTVLTSPLTGNSYLSILIGTIGGTHCLASIGPSVSQISAYPLGVNENGHFYTDHLMAGASFRVPITHLSNGAPGSGKIFLADDRICFCPPSQSVFLILVDVDYLDAQFTSSTIINVCGLLVEIDHGG